MSLRNLANVVGAVTLSCRQNNKGPTSGNLEVRPLLLATICLFFSPFSAIICLCGEMSVSQFILVNCYPRVIHTYTLQVNLALYIMYISSVRRFVSASLNLDVVNVLAHLRVIKIETPGLR